MTQLVKLAHRIRGKSAGRFELTFDITFEDEATYKKRVQNSGALAHEAVAQFFPAIKRMQSKRLSCRDFQSDPRDSDDLGGQQQAALMTIEMTSN